MKLSNLCIKKPVFTCMMMLTLITFGTLGLSRIGIDRYPNVSLPYITVQAHMPGADPKILEDLVTTPLENALASINGLTKITSSTTDSIVLITLEFQLNTPEHISFQDVESTVHSLQHVLPDEVTHMSVSKAKVNNLPILSYAVASPQPKHELSLLIDQEIKSQLGRVPGVASVEIQGENLRKIFIEVDPIILESYHLSPQDITQALKNQHVYLSAGTLKSPDLHYLITTDGEFKSIDELSELIITYHTPTPQKIPTPITLADVAHISYQPNTYTSYAQLDSEEALTLSIMKQSKDNTIDVVERVTQEIQKIQHTYPQLSFEPIFDLSEEISQSIHDLQFDLVVGGIFAILIVYLFLNHAKMTLIAALAIPTSVIATFGVLCALDFSINIMTTLALSLSIGILIDDAIVVIENIFRHFTSSQNPIQAAKKGTSEIALAAIAITLSIVAVFVPVAFMDGVIGKFFYEFGLTIAISVLVSLFVAFTLIPMCAAKFLASHNASFAQGFFPSSIRRLENVYAKLLDTILDYKKTLVACAIASFIVSLLFLTQLPMEFTSELDNHQIAIALQHPKGTPLPHLIQSARETQQFLAELPFVMQTYISIQENSSFFSIGLKIDPNAGPSYQIASQLRERIPKDPNQRLYVQPGSLLASPAGHPQLSLEIYDPSATTALDTANTIVRFMQNTPGFIEPRHSEEHGAPQFNLVAKQHTPFQITPTQIHQTLHSLFTPTAIAYLQDPQKPIPIELKLQNPSPETLKHLTIANHTNTPIPLMEFTQLEQTVTPLVIEHLNKGRIIHVGSSLEPPLILSQALEKIHNHITLSPSTSISFSGHAQDLFDTFKNFLFAMFLASLCIYIILASQFESFIDPLIIIFSLPFSWVGALATLYITNTPISIFSFIGTLLLMGLVTKNAILLVDYAKQLPLPPKQAIIKAGQTRLQPILMTTSAMIFGMLPIAFSTTPGSENHAPMAIVIIGGLLSSTILTLIIIPAIYLTCKKS